MKLKQITLIIPLRIENTSILIPKTKTEKTGFQISKLGLIFLTRNSAIGCTTRNTITRLFSTKVKGLATQLPMLTLYTKHPCPLCEEAVEQLRPYKHRFILEKVDISLPENMEWHRKYKYDIPVFHLNNKFLMKHHVNFKVLEEELSKWKASNGNK